MVAMHHDDAADGMVVMHEAAVTVCTCIECTVYVTAGVAVLSVTRPLCGTLGSAQLMSIRERLYNAECGTLAMQT